MSDQIGGCHDGGGSAWEIQHKASGRAANGAFQRREIAGNRDERGRPCLPVFPVDVEVAFARHRENICGVRGGGGLTCQKGRPCDEDLDVCKIIKQVFLFCRKSSRMWETAAPSDQETVCGFPDNVTQKNPKFRNDFASFWPECDPPGQIFGSAVHAASVSEFKKLASAPRGHLLPPIFRSSSHSPHQPPLLLSVCASPPHHFCV